MNLIKRNLVKAGDTVWCDLIGESVVKIVSKTDLTIAAKNNPNNFFVGLNEDGSYFDDYPGMCVIWPSKDERSWDNVIPDKALVEAWDDDEYTRTIGFFNKDLKRLYGQRYGWDNYKIIPNNEWPAWAHEYLKKLNEK